MVHARRGCFLSGNRLPTCQHIRDYRHCLGPSAFDLGWCLGWFDVSALTTVPVLPPPHLLLLHPYGTMLSGRTEDSRAHCEVCSVDVQKLTGLWDHWATMGHLEEFQRRIRTLLRMLTSVENQLLI